MKKLVLWLIVFAVSGEVVYAQDIAGTWQGTLQLPNGGPTLRAVLQITKADDQSLKAVFYSIDQGAQPLNAGAVSFQGSVLKVTLPAVGGNYEGRMSGDGNSIAGTFTQGGPLPLTFNRATPQTAWAIPEPPPPPKPMAPEANPVFEVATIKPSNPESRGSSILVGRGGSNMFTTTNTTLRDLITMAYGLHARQVVDGPSWIESERFDITAKPEHPGVPNLAQLSTMVQKLLAERFGLTFHKEKRELSAYVLTLAKSGPKMTKNESGNILPGFGGRGPGAVGVQNSSMPEFAGFLQARVLDRPVVDQTGLEGKFNFTLEFRPDAQLLAPPVGGPPPQLPPEIENRPDLFTAIQDQLGLKLESGKASVEVYVIDKVTKPTEN
jgi:uncharacterized protein (TIGR03435 family)